MSSILITGANQGIGREAARRLIADGHHVYMGARDPERGRAAATELGGHYVPIEVTDQASVDGAVAAVAEATGGSLDVLVNNAAVPSSFHDIDHLTATDYETVFAPNVFGVARAFHAFLPQLRAAPAGVVVNMSSGQGSHERTSDPERGDFHVLLPDYQASKAAVGMLTSQWARMAPELRINCVEPGWTSTQLGDAGGPVAPNSVEDAAEVVVRMATIGPDGPTGRFFERDGEVGW